MQELIAKDYEGLLVQFTNKGWFNATRVAEGFDKNPNEWLRLPATKKYLAALGRKYGKIPYFNTRRGSSGGTWLHPKLGVSFARWLDVDFAVWCDEQIEKIIHGEIDTKRARHQAASLFKVQCDILKLTREQLGKDTKPHHYINEARLVNWVMTGHFTALDLDALSGTELNLLARLEERNACLIAMGMSYPIRKQALKEYLAKCIGQDKAALLN